MSDASAKEVVMSALRIVQEAPVLVAADRCDRCPARAVVRVRKNVGEVDLDLDFCMHDFHSIETELTLKGFQVIVDDRKTLL